MGEIGSSAKPNVAKAAKKSLRACLARQLLQSSAPGDNTTLVSATITALRRGNHARKPARKLEPPLDISRAPGAPDDRVLWRVGLRAYLLWPLLGTGTFTRTHLRSSDFPFLRPSPRPLRHHAAGWPTRLHRSVRSPVLLPSE